MSNPWNPTTRVQLTVLLVSVCLLGPSLSPVEAQSAMEIRQTLGQNRFYGILFVFGLGLLLNLTPCVYPMIPITVGYFGNRKATSWQSSLFDALLYVLGMALIYTLLGAMAGLTGRMLGRALQSPLIQGSLALVMVFMAASMFGFFDLSFSKSMETRLRRFADGLGTFGMGMTLGVAAAPCLAPATVGLLGYVGNEGSLILGSSLFFTLSLGLGLPYLFLAVFSGFLHRLPDSGRWFQWIEKLLGHLLLGVALYFAWPLLSEDVMGGLVILWLTVATISLSLTVIPSNKLLFVGRTVALIALGALGIYWVTFNMIWLHANLDWTKGTKFVRKDSHDGPAVVYTGADWCVPCQELKVTTFQSERVLRASRGIQLVKIDLTDPPPKPVSDWLREHEIVGVPTMVFLRSDGQEIRELRSQGYISARKFSNRLRQLKQLPSGTSFF